MAGQRRKARGGRKRDSDLETGGDGAGRIVIPRRAVFCLGLSQLISWGVSYYLIGGFGQAIAADLHWSGSLVYGGYSAALLIMGLASAPVGRLIDRYGGRVVMQGGALLMAAGCAGIALAHGIVLYYAAWICLGLAMRLTLYDAAFAALVRLGGAAARRPIAEVTLLGGLASTVFWPLGHLLAHHFGWRGALLAYAGFALLTLPLHFALPAGRRGAAPAGAEAPAAHPPLAAGKAERAVAGLLYTGIIGLASFLNSGMSAHMIDILAGLGLGATAAVWISALRGVGQSSARLAEILFGRRIHPLLLNLLATLVLPAAFFAGLFSGRFALAALGFAFFYGAGNGIVTITRGTLPLVLFEHRTYGALVGRLLVPSFILAAAAPVVYALVIRHFGEMGGLVLSLGIALAMLAGSIVLRLLFNPGRA